METGTKHGKDIKFWLSYSEYEKLRRYSDDLDVPIVVALRMIILSVLNDDIYLDEFSLNDYYQTDIDKV